MHNLETKNPPKPFEYYVTEPMLLLLNNAIINYLMTLVISKFAYLKKSIWECLLGIFYFEDPGWPKTTKPKIYKNHKSWPHFMKDIFLIFINKIAGIIQLLLIFLFNLNILLNFNFFNIHFWHSYIVQIFSI